MIMTSLIARVTGVASVNDSDLRCHTVALTVGLPVCSVFQQGGEGKVRLLFIPPTTEVTHQAGA